MDAKKLKRVIGALTRNLRAALLSRRAVLSRLPGDFTLSEGLTPDNRLNLDFQDPGPNRDWATAVIRKYPRLAITAEHFQQWVGGTPSAVVYPDWIAIRKNNDGVISETWLSQPPRDNIKGRVGLVEDIGFDFWLSLLATRLLVEKGNDALRQGVTHVRSRNGSCGTHRFA